MFSFPLEARERLNCSSGGITDMATSRRAFLGSWLIPAWEQQAASPVFPPVPAARALFPCPAEGAVCDVNPPGFAWWRAQGAAAYRLIVRNGAGATVLQSPALPDPVHVPDHLLPSGDYTWDVEALDAKSAVMATRGRWKFSVSANAVPMPWQDAKKILVKAAADHPRLLPLPPGKRTSPWADRALKTALPEPPDYHTFTGAENAARRRMGYITYSRRFRRAVDNGMGLLATAFHATGDSRYGEAAKKILLAAEPWGVEGPMSLLSPDGDEPGLSMARHGHRAYDWLYPLLSAAEREKLRAFTVARARQIFTRLKKADYLYTPAESHNGRLIAYLAEHAIVLKDEAPEAPVWLDYALRALMTFYPHWGGSDGGWAEGISYAVSYNTLYIPALEAIRSLDGPDLLTRPFFRNFRKFLFYCVAPQGEMRPFGDGAENPGVGPTGTLLMNYHGRRFGDPTALWWAAQTGEFLDAASDPLLTLLEPSTVQPAAPVRVPQDAVFPSIGWAALHSSIDDPKHDTLFLFKSSPFGSVSHSHADQNAFAILKGGRVLAIPSGYYGPAYGMPHHALWTRQTKANNTILVNSQGQTDRDPKAAGRIVRSILQPGIAYLCGDATPAYNGRLTRFLRHVLFLRPGAFLLLDELAAPGEAEFEWRMHALERMDVDSQELSVTSNRTGALVTARFACDAGLFFDQLDHFDTPYNEGNPEEFHDNKVNQWHFRAVTSNKSKATRIAASLIVRDEDDAFVTRKIVHAGWHCLAVECDAGKGEFGVQFTPYASAPSSAPSGSKLLYALWKPKKGDPETVIL